MPTIAEFFQSIYTSRLAMGGIIAFIALLIAGVLYLTSAGDPNKLREARERFKAVFIGLLILYSSYIILLTINPNLVSFEIPSLEEVVIDPEEGPPLEPIAPTLLERVQELARGIAQEAGPGIERSADRIQGSALECSCIFAQSSCMCTGGTDDDDCEAQGCYAGTGSHPCRDWEQIQENQRLIIAWRDELIYYKNRGIAEAQDLLREIEEILNPQINYFEDARDAEEDPELIGYYNNEIARLEQEKDLKEDIIEQVAILALLIDQIGAPAEELAALPNRCVYDDEGSYGLANTCDGMCIGDCHDTFIGCQSLPCIGLNPCPLIEIMAQNGFLRAISSPIIDAAEEILDDIDQLITLKTIFI